MLSRIRFFSERFASQIGQPELVDGYDFRSSSLIFSFLELLKQGLNHVDQI